MRFLKVSERTSHRKAKEVSDQVLPKAVATAKVNREMPLK
jgi:hypothetical protein